MLIILISSFIFVWLAMLVVALFVTNIKRGKIKTAMPFAEFMQQQQVLDQQLGLKKSSGQQVGAQNKWIVPVVFVLSFYLLFAGNWLIVVTRVCQAILFGVTVGLIGYSVYAAFHRIHLRKASGLPYPRLGINPIWRRLMLVLVGLIYIAMLVVFIIFTIIAPSLLEMI